MSLDTEFVKVITNEDEVLYVLNSDLNIETVEQCAKGASNEESDDDEPTATLWTAKKATPLDKKATRRLLELRGSDKYKALFNDKKTLKGDIWQQIALEMLSENFPLPRELKLAGEKCRIRFTNLQRIYDKFINQIKEKGTECKEDPPIYFELMHNILGEKHGIPIEFLNDHFYPKLEIKEIIQSLKDIVDDRSSGAENDSEEPPCTLWTAKKATNRDHEATLRLLELRGSDEYKALFSNKRSLKTALWQKIANQLISEGFPLPRDLKAAGEKCRVRFSNLRRSYMIHMNDAKNGVCTSRPMYFDILHPMLEDHFKKNSENYDDSYQDLEQSIETPVRDPLVSPTSSQTQETKQLSKRATIKFIKDMHEETIEIIRDELSQLKEDILELPQEQCSTQTTVEAIKEMHKETIQAIREELSQIREEMRRGNQLREELLDTFHTFIRHSRSRKRKREDSSSASESPTDSVPAEFECSL